MPGLIIGLAVIVSCILLWVIPEEAAPWLEEEEEHE